MDALADLQSVVSAYRAANADADDDSDDSDADDDSDEDTQAGNPVSRPRSPETKPSPTRPPPDVRDSNPMPRGSWLRLHTSNPTQPNPDQTEPNPRRPNPRSHSRITLRSVWDHFGTTLKGHSDVTLGSL